MAKECGFDPLETGARFQNIAASVTQNPGAAISSENTGAAATSVPRLNAASKAFCAAKLRFASLSHNAITTFVSTAVVICLSSRAATFQYFFCRTEYLGYRCRDILKTRSGF